MLMSLVHFHFTGRITVRFDLPRLFFSCYVISCQENWELLKKSSVDTCVCTFHVRYCRKGAEVSLDQQPNALCLQA